MPSAQDLRKRIKSVSNTQQITKAMKMVASARLRRAQTKAQDTAPYADKLSSILHNVSANISGMEAMNPLLEKRDVKKTAYLIIGADKGLAGSYTSNLIKYVTPQLSELNRDSYSIITVGRKPFEHLQKFRNGICSSYKGFSDKPTFAHAQKLSDKICKLFLDGEVDRVVMVYTYFVNSLTQEVREVQLLPVVTDMAEDKTEDKTNNFQYEFIPDEVAIFETLLPRYLEITIYNGLLQSAASELGARMTAMTSATDNASELIAKLDLYYNKIRQSGITNEISEIVGGANALE